MLLENKVAVVYSAGDTKTKLDIVANLLPATLLSRTATLADVGKVTASVVSDPARTITSTDVNISYGAIVD